MKGCLWPKGWAVLEWFDYMLEGQEIMFEGHEIMFEGRNTMPFEHV